MYSGKGSRKDQGNKRGYSGQATQEKREPTFNFEPSFFKQDGALNTEWLDKKISSFADELQMTNTQLRNFYNEFLRIRAIPDNNPDEKLVFIKMLKAKAKYKENSVSNLEMQKYRLFTQFIVKLVDEINDDLERFQKSCYIMEALVGFSRK